MSGITENENMTCYFMSCTRAFAEHLLLHNSKLLGEVAYDSVSYCLKNIYSAVVVLYVNYLLLLYFWFEKAI